MNKKTGKLRDINNVYFNVLIKYDRFDIFGKFQLSRDKLSFSKFVVMFVLLYPPHTPSSSSISKFCVALCTWISSLTKNL